MTAALPATAAHCPEMFLFATESLKKTGSVCVVDNRIDLDPALQRNDLKLIGVGFIEHENRPDGDQAVACMIKGDKNTSQTPDQGVRGRVPPCPFQASRGRPIPKKEQI